jgi:hypothetical protein
LYIELNFTKSIHNGTTPPIHQKSVSGQVTDDTRREHAERWQVANIKPE